jgi:uncharacterized membrane protein YhhN
MNYTFLILALIIALVDWYAVAKEWKTLEYVAKPGVMLSLLAWMWAINGFEGPLFWFTLGLVFSLAGDVFLMLPRDRFIPGLVSFLLAHLAYVMGFTRSLPPANLTSLVLALLVTIAAGRIYRRIAASLAEAGETKLRTPVLTYTNVISLMLLAALLTLIRPDWSTGPALLSSAGALLFFASDGLLAWNKFVEKLRYGKLLVIITYHLGQVLIVLGAALHYLA